MYTKIINIIILFTFFIIFFHIFKIFKIYDKRSINKKFNLIPYEHIQTTDDPNKQTEPYNYSDIYEYAIFKTHPFKHPNDIDLHLAELRNGMNILDAGCGLIGPAIYFSNNLPKSKIHVVSNGGSKYQTEIKKKIKNNYLTNKIIPHFDDYHKINKIFKLKTFDRILFIESFNYSNDIENLLNNCYNLLKVGGKIYIRTIIMPKTNNQFLKNKYSMIQNQLNGYIHYHDNIIYYLQNSNFYNIKYTSVPLFFSENIFNPIFLLTLNKLGLINTSYLFAAIPLTSCTYIATKIK
jgi:SAM-dependent methyltransferase